MEILSLYRASVLMHLQSGASCKLAYEHAALDTICLPHVRRAMIKADISPGRALDQLIKRVVEGSLPADLVQFVVRDDGPLVSVPRPDCMERYLPKDRRPTDEEFQEAWAQCAVVNP
jgi:hypothetical protein